VQLDDVEREFWRNVINFESNVITKYGADLITSKVGSGFPRKNDDYKGMDLKARNLYANHPWNLNNLPVLKESVLSHMNIPVSGKKIFSSNMQMLKKFRHDGPLGLCGDVFQYILLAC
jgi:[histone H3]-trimethyl-L-lysine4 demethylase